MRHTISIMLLIMVLMLTSCNDTRKEVASSLKNIPEAAEYLAGTELDEDQFKAVQAIAIAVNPAIDWLGTDWLGRDSGAKATVTVDDWKQNSTAAKEAVIVQATIAQSAVDNDLNRYAGWQAAFWAGLATLVGTTIAGMARSLIVRTQALDAAIDFGMKAIDARTDSEIEAVKNDAVKKKEGTSFETVLNARLAKARDEHRLAKSPTPTA